ncbi:MAG: galactokinase [Gemmatimonadetes bacterium]|nr:galactokinase [Gemmatimonadota bacterium]
MDCSDKGSVTSVLLEAGFGNEAEERAGAFVTSAKVLGPSVSALRAWWVPGRIEVLGKHTDYAGGRSLLCATDRGIAFVVKPRPDKVISITDSHTGDTDSFEASPDLDTSTGDWRNYPRTAVRRIASNFGALSGVEIAFHSNLPQAAGMSSSSALIVGFALILIRTNGLDGRDIYKENIGNDEELAGYLGTVENGQTFGTLEGDAGVGTFGGSEDHTAILCASADTLKRYAFCPVQHERTVGFPRSLTFVVASSGVVAEKTGGALELYNRASRLAGAVTNAINTGLGDSHPHLAAAIQSVGVDGVRSALSGATDSDFGVDDLLDRFDQFVRESEQIIPAATDALDGNDVEGFARYISESQANGARRLKNQVEETVWLAEQAERLGARSASAFGAGFGGSVYALVDTDRAAAFASEWASAYRSAFPARADASVFFITRPGPATFELADQSSTV